MEWLVLTLLGLRASADALQGPTGGGLGGGLGATLLSALLVGFGGLWLVVQRLEGRPLLRTPVAWALVAVVFAAGLSSLTAQDLTTSVLDVGRLASAVVLYLVLERLYERTEQGRLVIGTCLASAVLPLAVGALQVATGYSGRLQATFQNPNAYAFYLALIITVGVAVWRDVHRWALQLGLALLLVAAVAELLLTYSRGGWIAATVGLLVVATFRMRILIPAIALLIVLVPVVAPSVAERVALLDTDRTATGTGGNSLLWRFDYWEESLSLVEPWTLNGLGFGMVREHSESGLEPHNDFVRMYVETGLVGLAAYLGLAAAMAYTGWRALRRAAPGLDHGVATAALAVTASFLIVSVGGTLVSIPVDLWYGFAVLAAGSGLAFLAPTEPADGERTAAEVPG
jgi:O-antigen ligase